MAHVLFSEYPYTWSHSQEERLAGKIRLSIFLIAAECGGLPALLWALRVLYDRYESGGRISALIIMLLLSNLLELLLNPYIVITLLQDENCWESSTTCWILTSLWSASMIFGLLIQQAVVLEGALAFRHPHCSAHAFFPSCSVITSMTAFTCFLLSEIFSAILAIALSLSLFLVLPLASCIITCRAPPQINDIPYRTRKPSSTVLVFVSFTMILHVFPIICIFVRGSGGLWVMHFSLMSLKVIIDPLLCVLVYRKDLKVQKPEHNTHIELTQIKSSATPNTHPAQEV